MDGTGKKEDYIVLYTPADTDNIISIEDKMIALSMAWN